MRVHSFIKVGFVAAMVLSGSMLVFAMPNFTGTYPPNFAPMYGDVSGVSGMQVQTSEQAFSAVTYRAKPENAGSAWEQPNALVPVGYTVGDFDFASSNINSK